MTPSYREAALERRRGALRIWSMSLATPILYLAIAWVINWIGWVETGPQVERSLDTPAVWAALFVLGGAALGVGAIWRAWRPARLAGLQEDPDPALDRWMFSFYVSAGAADLTAFLGLVGFILTSRHEALLIGGVAGYLGYALAYPARGEVDRGPGT